MPPLAGNLVPGDRVSSVTGIVGTVVGLPTRNALRAVAVYVRWDDGREGDERVSSLRPTKNSVSRPANKSAAQPQGARVGGGYPRAGVPDARPGTAGYRNDRQVGASPGRPGSARPASPGGMNVAASGGSSPSRSSLDTKNNAATSVRRSASTNAGIQDASGAREQAARARSVPHQEDRVANQHGPGVATAQLRGAVRRRSHFGDETLQQDSGQPNPMEVLRRHSLSTKEKNDPTPRKRMNSQWCFAERSQTVIVFDWDDTLFPTSFLIDEMKLDWRFPVTQQRWPPSTKREVVAKLANCEAFAVSLLQRAHACGHVVVVTLAAKGWVEQACRFFYSKVGDLLRTYRIKIVNAQDKAKSRQMLNVLPNGKPLDPSNMEEYYGLLKGKAIAEEIDRFYSQYEGQTWKNVLSIGDSRFERYGLLAASTAYMQRRRVSTLDGRPFQPGQRGAWQKVEGEDHLIHLRVKVCKLVDNPDMDELAIELEMVAKWLNLMVTLNEGFDLDLEALVDSSLVGVVEAVLRGERPVSDMPLAA